MPAGTAPGFWGGGTGTVGGSPTAGEGSAPSSMTVAGAGVGVIAGDDPTATDVTAPTVASLRGDPGELPVALGLAVSGPGTPEAGAMPAVASGVLDLR